MTHETLDGPRGSIAQGTNRASLDLFAEGMRTLA